MSYYPKPNCHIRDNLRCVDTSLAAKKSLLAGKKSLMLWKLRLAS